ncbi:MAG TPA: tRNA (adenosine(37)-N6)-dimethylallyltransferase MiaA, partial [Devosiaceae bacterium]|nr:tRNA (adenosine(37)-N6)-dimethylallyltransferase MiaA [Devosiaceae bacterium]
MLIAGPTAAGKTRLAIERAQATGAAVVCADSMQVYSVLDRLTARPGAAELAAAPHLLFGYVPPSVRHSAGKWLKDIDKIVTDRVGTGQDLIFVGGTGLYFEALTIGLSQMPESGGEADTELRGLLRSMDQDARRALIEAEDPKMAGRLSGFDPQRVARALAVKRATGTSLADWQDEAGRSPLAGWRIERMVVAPPRAVLRERIAARFAAMLEEGAVEEVKALLALQLDPGLPAMKAIGVREISAMLDGALSRDEAVER